MTAERSATARHRVRLASPRTAAVLACVMVVLFAILLLESALAHRLTAHNLGAAVSLTTLTVVIAAVGLVVARHQPRNPIGWLLARRC